MIKNRTGERAYIGSAGVGRKRIRLGTAKFLIKLNQCVTQAQADKRGDLLAMLATRMTLAATHEVPALIGLKRIGAAPADLSEKAALEIVDELIGGWRPDSTCPTFAEVCCMWNGGSYQDHSRDPVEIRTYKPNHLALRYKDESIVAMRKESTTIRAAIATLRKHILPLIGQLPVDLITDEHGDAIKEQIAKTVPLSDSRRQVLTPFKTVMDICVKLKLIKRSPLPEGFLPAATGPRTLQWIKPAEYLQLMRCTEIPLWRRTLWGFYTCNGARKNEALVMAISQFDLGELPIATLFGHQCKTGEDRSWAMIPGDAEGLRAWVALARSDARPGDRMFVDGNGQPIDDNTLPDLLRADLQTAGVTRPELFVTTETSRRICPHDLRGSFVTVKLACRWTPDQIQGFTGHESPEQMKAYKRRAKSLREAAERAKAPPADFVSMALAIPELAAWVQQNHPAAWAELQPASGHGVATRSRNVAQPLQAMHSIVEHQGPTQPLEFTENPIHSRPTDGAQPGPAALRGHALAAQTSPDAQRVAALEAQVQALLALLVDRQATAGTVRTVPAGD